MFKTIINPFQLLKILSIAIVLVISFDVNGFLVNGTWAQTHPHASLIFSPSFVKLFSVIVFGWYGLAGVILGTLFLMNNDGTIYIMFLNIVFFACSPMIALLITNRLCKLSAVYDNLKYYHIILLSLIASSFGILNGVFIHDSFDAGISMMAGDFFTDMVLLFSFSIILRGREFFTKNTGTLPT